MNKVILIGRLTKDPELKYTQNNNTPFSNYSLAVDRRFVKQGEERQTDFINIVAWNKLAEFSTNYLKKGTKISLVGRIQVRNWEDDSGAKKYVTEVVAEEVNFVESKKSQNQETTTNTNEVENDTLPY